MPNLQLLRSEHASAVLAFELANRAYFTDWVPDRGDEYFEQFTQRHEALLAEQANGIGAYYLLIGEEGLVLGRFNLVFAGDGAVELGYRVAQHVAGRGLATAAVRELCRMAAAWNGIRTLRAAAAIQNAASRKVLTKAGFVPVGPADPASPGGQPGTWYHLDLERVAPTATAGKGNTDE